MFKLIKHCPNGYQCTIIFINKESLDNYLSSSEAKKDIDNDYKYQIIEDI